MRARLLRSDVGGDALVEELHGVLDALKFLSVRLGQQETGEVSLRSRDVNFCRYKIIE